MNLIAKQKLEIERQLSQTDDLLFEELGEVLRKKSLGASPASPEKNRDTGYSWFVRNKSLLAQTVCPHPIIQSFRTSDDENRRVELVAAIADLLLERYGGLPVVTIAVILVHEGIEQLCKEEHVDK